MSEMLYRRIEPLEEDTLVQYLGCYALRWGRDPEASCGFVEAREEMDALDAAQQRIAALEAQAQTANLRAERLVGALVGVLGIPTPKQWEKWPHNYERAKAALAAAPDASPLRQVREALAQAPMRTCYNPPSGRTYRYCQLCRGEDGEHTPDCPVGTALRLLAELGVCDATS